MPAMRPALKLATRAEPRPVLAAPREAGQKTHLEPAGKSLCLRKMFCAEGGKRRPFILHAYAPQSDCACLPCLKRVRTAPIAHPLVRVADGDAGPGGTAWLKAGAYPAICRPTSRPPKLDMIPSPAPSPWLRHDSARRLRQCGRHPPTRRAQASPGQPQAAQELCMQISYPDPDKAGRRQRVRLFNCREGQCGYVDQ